MDDLDKLNLLDNDRWKQFVSMCMSRTADERESLLFKQGRGQFHVSGSGHETVASLAPFIEKKDHLYCHYRDRALILALGVPLYQAALGYYAKADSDSGGRQLVNHFSNKQKNIMPAATPVALQCLPAAGSAWAFKLNYERSVSFCLMGEASTRQGEFFEAIAFCIEKDLPAIFIVEDNGYGISTPTHETNPAALGIIPDEILCPVDGRDIENCTREFETIISNVREGGGPKVIWLLVDRLTSHTGSDDHTRYRDEKELETIKSRDPLISEKQHFLENGLVSEDDFSKFETDIKAYVKTVYERAEIADEPDMQNVSKDIFFECTSNKEQVAVSPIKHPYDEWNMAEAWNYTLDTLLKEKSNALLFGQDIEDPKGGVFGLTKELSEKHPGRVYNSPLAEATIAGVASGLSMSGFLPIFEMQFSDFLGNAFNQIVNQIATLRWRSNGAFENPLILYAPCGSYISNGGPWHNQTNESWFAQAPGLKVLMPSNANDAANLLYSSAHGKDPVLILLPKNLFRPKVVNEKVTHIYPHRAKIKKSGDHVTLLAWGNCVGLTEAAAKNLEQDGVRCEIIDLCSLVPCDWETIHHSVQKTGRLVIVQENNKTCSFGQSIIHEVCSRKATWDQLYASPELVCREDVHIGFSRNLEKAILPNVKKITDAINKVLGRMS